MNTVFLICPDCHIEQAIRNWFGRNCYFLTALGAVFHFNNFEFAEEVHQFVAGEGVKYIYIVNALSCTFVRRVAQGEVVRNVDGVNVLMSLAVDCKEDIDRVGNPGADAFFTAKTNILRQARELSDAAYFRHEIEAGDIVLKGLIYDRNEHVFMEMPIKRSSLS
jgi:hypothetical protein